LKDLDKEEEREREYAKGGFKDSKGMADMMGRRIFKRKK